MEDQEIKNETAQPVENETENQETTLPVEEQPVDETASAIKELEEQKDKYIRLLAEFENFKRRTSKERIELFKTAGLEVIKDLLPSLDDVDRAEQVVANAKDLEAVKEGIKLISEKLKNTLSQKGLKEIECKGLEFNTDLMEAITEIPAPTEELKGKVVDVLEKGYTLNEKIIRYAKVVIGK
jgi:molecular chaperone GrpE